MNPEICSRCTMNGQRRSQIYTVGQGPCELLLVGHSPQWTDAATGAPYTGNAYMYIWQLLSSIGVNFYVTTLYKCKSTGVCDTCLEQFQEEVRTLQPKCILFMGEKTLTAAIPEAKMAEYRSYSHWYYGCRCFATYDPYYVTPDNEMLYSRFIDDLVYACRHAIAYRESPKYTSKTLTKDQFKEYVNQILADPMIEYVGFDTESNGLDPLVPGSKITSFSVCTDRVHGYNVFLYHPEMLETITDQDRAEIIEDAKRLLLGKKVVVQHAKHEHRMIKVLWGFTPNITEDTMYMSYILYLSYPGISHGLKYLSGRFANLPPWEENLYRFVDMFKRLKRHKTIDDELVKEIQFLMQDVAVLSADDIMEMFRIIKDPDYPIKTAPTETEDDPFYWLVPSSIMENYAGMDAIAPLLLMDRFKPTIEADSGLKDAYRLMVEGAEVFANVELHGVRLVALDQWSKRYDVKLKESMDKIRSYKEVQDYELETGNKFNPGSSKVLSDVMYSRMKFPVLEHTDKGAPRTNETVLIDLIKRYQEAGDDQYRLDFLLELRDYKKFAKIKSAYWEGLKRFIHEGKSFDGHTCEYYDIGGDVESSGRCDIINPGYMLHGTDSVIAGTLVMTKNGPVEIESLCDALDYEYLPKGFYSINQDVEVFDGDQYRTPLGFYFGGTRSCIRIKSSDGDELVGTPEHPVYTESGWKSLGDLKVGDSVLKIKDVGSYQDRITLVESAGDLPVFDLVMDVPDD